MAAPFLTQRRVEFVDTDLSGIVHFSRYMIFMETAEHQFREAIGFNVHCEGEGAAIGWPRVHAACDYKTPLRFGDVVDIEVAVARRGRSSLSFHFTLRVGERIAATGVLTSVCCRIQDGDLELIAIPAELAVRIDATPGPNES
ncbi:MAG: acyl-CoA thioesterase [Thermoanaerobaculia bacterium]|nr:acyl-CoA thioesterase [Thermoanaerobaculia bacterium]